MLHKLLDNACFLVCRMKIDGSISDLIDGQLFVIWGTMVSASPTLKLKIKVLECNFSSRVEFFSYICQYEFIYFNIWA